MTIGALWRGWRDKLAGAGIANAALEAKWLTGHALGRDFLGLSLEENTVIAQADAERLAALMRRRLTGEPMARITGEKEFYGLTLGLNAATLEPRPETELLVDLALKAVPANGLFLDLGTGTGAIAIAILANWPGGRGVASDLSPQALLMAQENARRHNVADRLDLVAGNWFEALEHGPKERKPVFCEKPCDDKRLERRYASVLTHAALERFDLIVANPPYIASPVIPTLAREVKAFDPPLALDGGPDGLTPYRRIFAEARHWLAPAGTIMVEIGHDQGPAILALLAEHGLAQGTVYKDLAGHNRVAVAQRQN